MGERVEVMVPDRGRLDIVLLLLLLFFVSSIFLSLETGHVTRTKTAIFKERLLVASWSLTRCPGDQLIIL